MKIDTNNFHRIRQHADWSNGYISDEYIVLVIRMCKRYIEDKTFRTRHTEFSRCRTGLGLCRFFSDVHDLDTDKPKERACYSKIAFIIVTLYKMLYGRGPRHDGYISKEHGATKARINFCQRVVDYFEVKEEA